MSGNYWVNPPPGNNTSDDTFIQGLWVVGEQRNLSWVTAVKSSTNLSLIQDEMDPGLGSITATFLTGYDKNSLVWIVQLYKFSLDYSKVFYFSLEGNGFSDRSASFTIAYQSGPSSATFTPTLGPTAKSTSTLGSTATSTPVLGLTKPSVSVPAIVTLTLSTVQTATSSSSLSSAPLTGLSRENLGIALGVGIPGLIAILISLFVLFKQKTIPEENPTQCTPRRVRPRAGIFEVTAAGDFTYRAELSEDRNSPHFAELPA